MARLESKTEGLDLYVHVARTFADSPWLHYGYWKPDEHVSVPNLRNAQERYVKQLLKLFPSPPATVLDIGGGTGEMAALLTTMGYRTDMLTPSRVQIEAAREKLPAGHTHHTAFEDFDTGRKFDVLLFSESFQYVPLDKSLPKAKSLLAAGGRIIISDFFRKRLITDELYPGGGHLIGAFEEAVTKYGLVVRENRDVTAFVAPTMALDQNIYRGFVAPLISQIDHSGRQSHPVLHWIVIALINLFTSRETRRRFQERLKADYRSPERFMEVNSYRFLTLESAD